MKDNLVKKSLLNTTIISSSIHSEKKIVTDNKIENTEYILPQTYDKNSLVLLLVNSNRSYFYWEFTEKFLHKNSVIIEDISFHILDQKHNLLENIPCTTLQGEYFYTIDPTNLSPTELKIIAVYKHGALLKNLLESNSIKLFNTKIIYPKDIDQVFMKKENGFKEVIRASMTHFTLGVSSASYLQEIERLQEYSRFSLENCSSKNLGEKK